MGGGIVAAQRFTSFRLQYDVDERVLWCNFDYTGRPCFAPQVLNEAQQVQHLCAICACRDRAGEDMPLRYLVLGSRAPGVWNLGGDSTVPTLIQRRDARSDPYAHQCCEVAIPMRRCTSFRS